MPQPNPLIVAIDTSSLPEAVSLAVAVRPHCFALKFGLEFFLSHGAAGVHAVLDAVAMDEFKIMRMGVPHAPFMLDLKLHDTPDTVAAAMRAILPLRPWAVTVHASSRRMMEAAVKAAASAAASFTVPKVLAVTVMSSSLKPLDTARRAVDRGARSAMYAGCDGIVCPAPTITPDLRNWLRVRGRTIVCPGIRPLGSSADDQVMIVAPGDAVRAGADYIVVGRPISREPDSAAAARGILAEALS